LEVGQTEHCSQASLTLVVRVSRASLWLRARLLQYVQRSTAWSRVTGACPAGPYVTGALFDLHGGKQTAMIVLGAIQFALGVLILFFRPKQQAQPRRAHPSARISAAP